MMNKQEILEKLPYSAPFLFVDDLLTIDENGATGTYTFNKDLDFYKGHFKDHPVTPGVILTETMAQIGMVCLGIYLSGYIDSGASSHVMLTSTAIDFIKPVFPGEKVTVVSEKVYFRFKKLHCKVEMKNEAGDVVCKGTLSGMVTKKLNG
ncbi:3-hydroxyacyl-ACP dehydratase FabZ family protein [Pedobacter sp.]|jgi:3-hydroxyacyl-[acyl-carrier-protein] dehydratase|uniref:3-hydroxyacyl-ACP dehydratase FabZ family protein n=1 Tax=Pedobacter sp. TaxID=1411316 RepID=UPI002B803C99|nr:3-hydroxyacyl-ACP dehydratase FabZ family protein [Pedobacter sp.]HWW38396.1 3-hydroxyacyl-ACP dehydratase FabZ family protein [Pedobacter sp.]